MKEGAAERPMERKTWYQTAGGAPKDASINAAQPSG
jgi:hypothetical protein